MELTSTRETANDRFKDGFGNWFWGSVVAAALIHFMLFAFWPSMSTADVSFSTEELAAIELPPEVTIPPPPEQIARPATPVIGDATIDEDITIASTSFEDNPVDNLPPPPTASASQDLSAAPQFTPFTVHPELKNRADVARALERNYPALLRDAGIGGEVIVWFFIDENGRVQRTQINKSSGYDQLDQAALKVAEVMEYTPALNRDKRVPVWVQIPIVFTSR